jgi:hypothetical protein
MKYRDAKKLVKGDEVISKESKMSYTVTDIEVYGQVNYVRINVVHKEGASVSFLHDEIE